MGEIYDMSQITEIGRVVCVGEDGRLHTVIQRQKIINHPSYGKAKGTIDFVTSTGVDVNQLDDGRFQIVMTDEILTPKS